MITIGAVAKLLNRTEVMIDKQAQKAMDDEFYRLQNSLTWDISKVQRRATVAEQAQNRGEDVHFGRIFGIC